MGSKTYGENTGNLAYEVQAWRNFSQRTIFLTRMACEHDIACRVFRSQAASIDPPKPMVLDDCNDISCGAPRCWFRGPIQEDGVALWIEFPNHIWLVVWNMNFILPYIGNNNPNWLIFFRGVQTTNQTW